MIRRINIFANIDWLTVLLYLTLVMLGWINIYAAVYNDEYHSIMDVSQKYGKQMVWIVFALIIAFSILIIDMNFYSYFSYSIYGLMIFLLIGVLIFGKTVNGAKSWFQIGSFLLQPAEFAKTATALALAKYITTKNISLIQFKSIAISLSILAAPALLILLQPDAGSTLIYAAFILTMYRQGLPPWVIISLMLIPVFFIFSLILPLYITIIAAFFVGVIWYLGNSGNLKNAAIFTFLTAISALGLYYSSNYINFINNEIIYLAGAGLVLIITTIISLIKRYRKPLSSVFTVFIILIFTYSADYVVENVLKEHQRNRIHIMLDPSLDPQGYGYNLNQSKIAIGSGGLSGKGFLKGTQTKFDFVPEQSTDFIFCTVGEEWGFIGSAFVIMLFIALLLRILFISERQRSRFARVYGYSVAGVLFFHIAVNISMTIGLFPVVGIPLPFFSYGGSSLWAFTILLFILLNFDARRLEIMR